MFNSTHNNVTLDEEDEETPKKKRLRKGTKIIHTSQSTDVNEVKGSDEESDDDIQRVLKKSRMEYLRDRSQRKKEDRSLRKVIRQSARDYNKLSPPTVEVDDDDEFPDNSASTAYTYVDSGDEKEKNEEEEAEEDDDDEEEEGAYLNL